MDIKFSFTKDLRLLTRKHYWFVDKGGGEKSGALIRVRARKGRYVGPKLGITVSRRFGKAVQRNRFKRLVREAFRLSQHKLSPQLQINVRPLALAHTATMQEIKQELTLLLATFEQSV